MIRKKTFMTFREAENCGPYDERPMLPDNIDPQLHLSRNDRPQPFFLICEKDTLLVQVSGKGRIEFRDTNVLQYSLEPGDFIYVPGGAPHRITPEEVSINYRYKPRQPGLEGVAWYCGECGREIHREIWDTGERLPQEGYIRACRNFNASKEFRACAGCGAAHDRIDLAPYRWERLAEELRSPDA